MRFLLDTHIAMWAVIEPHRLGPHVQGWIIDSTNDVAVSIVSLWEIAIKRSVRRNLGAIPQLSPEAAQSAFVEAEFDILAISTPHLTQVEKLPFHHRDPFDRLLVAQAKGEGLTLLTHDKKLGGYGDFVMVV